ncbi:Methyltransferase type 11 [Alkaliphilus metalliredigens QYMF]|uniref:Methyltransferase type 11 n=1 Tax=Alkaliphilus metalliredigens (strain QYMF) TaxID=293826 RepID=A6TNN5_ALKMQ|nr:class I SAM-dependent methyltransferase [Alkaliphilus metalliredigens]ABR47803.1 Methyltransferase type 11 [Alkaliphilus metalliredigens QYMF]
MSEQYGEFAYLYDRLMEDVNYPQWIDYIEEIFKRENLTEKEVLELACGTGNITMPLAKRGYRITASDLSQDMLTVAHEKSLENHVDVVFVNQNMAEIEFHRQFPCILCLCDGINYVIEPEDLMDTYQGIYEHLQEGGLFIFDISSYYKLKYVLGEHTFGENLDDLVYLWENSFDEEDEIIEMNLTFFTQGKDKGQCYEKFEETHFQKAYQATHLVQMLKAVGFSQISTQEAFTFESVKEQTERIFFICKK